MGTSNWTVGVADHRSLPVADHSVDIVVSGWSVCYFIHWDKQNWKNEVEKTLDEMKRVLRPGGMIILLETQGTGFSEPNPPEHLRDYFQYLHDQGFVMEIIRTDYRFKSVDEAVKHSRFFFGEEMAARVITNNSEILPECTGIWWKRILP
jgi:ubiquinone/menaquinone biosynthesis C-methylase UbiE